MTGEKSQQISSTANSPPRKSVSFSRSCMMMIIPGLNHYTREERSRIWMDADAFDVIRKDCSEVASKLRQGEKETEDICFRGLEWKAKGVARTKKLRRYRASIAVLDEQEDQWEKLQFDPEAIARAYEPHTRSSTVEAYARAKRDEEAALGVQRHNAVMFKQVNKEPLSFHPTFQNLTVT